MNAFVLKIIAIVAMTFDHIGAEFLPFGLGYEPYDMIFRIVGRLTMPIMCFFIGEGFTKTRNRGKYAVRLAVFAVISEIPFNLAMASSVIYPFHQNVLWSFLIALGLIHCNEKAKASEKLRIRIAVGIFTILAGYLLVLITMVD